MILSDLIATLRLWPRIIRRLVANERELLAQERSREQAWAEIHAIRAAGGRADIDIDPIRKRYGVRTPRQSYMESSR